jgi:hypothetical protein
MDIKLKTYRLQETNYPKWMEGFGHVEENRA